MSIVPANALTVISHLGTGLLLTLAYVWEGFGRQAWGTLFYLERWLAPSYPMYEHMEKQEDNFLGLRRSYAEGNRCAGYPQELSTGNEYSHCTLTRTSRNQKESDLSM